MRRPKPVAPFLPDQALWLLPPLGLVLLICVCCFCLCLCCRGGSGGAGMYTGAAANALKIEVKGLGDDTADGQVRQTVAAGGRRSRLDPDSATRSWLDATKDVEPPGGPSPGSCRPPGCSRSMPAAIDVELST